MDEPESFEDWERRTRPPAGRGLSRWEVGYLVACALVSAFTWPQAAAVLAGLMLVSALVQRLRKLSARTVRVLDTASFVAFLGFLAANRQWFLVSALVAGYAGPWLLDRYRARVVKA